MGQLWFGQAAPGPQRYDSCHSFFPSPGSSSTEYKHLSGFLSPAPASCLHSQGSSWVDYQLYGHPIQDPLKSCLTISGSKENRCSGPILYLLGTNMNPQRASRFATRGYSSCSLLPSEISTFAGTYLCLISLHPFTTASSLFWQAVATCRWSCSVRQACQVLLGMETPRSSDFIYSDYLQSFSWCLSPPVPWGGTEASPDDSKAHILWI